MKNVSSQKGDITKVDRSAPIASDYNQCDNDLAVTRQHQCLKIIKEKYLLISNLLGGPFNCGIIKLFQFSSDVSLKIVNRTLNCAKKDVT